MILLHDLSMLILVIIKSFISDPSRSIHKTNVLGRSISKIKQHFVVYRLKKWSYLVYRNNVDISKLVLGHDVTKDNRYYARMQIVNSGKTMQAKTPIKVLIPYMIVLDGNHRVSVLKECNVKSIQVECYVLHDNKLMHNIAKNVYCKYFS